MDAGSPEDVADEVDEEGIEQIKTALELVCEEATVQPQEIPRINWLLGVDSTTDVAQIAHAPRDGAAQRLLSLGAQPRLPGIAEVFNVFATTPDVVHEVDGATTPDVVHEVDGATAEEESDGAEALLNVREFMRVMRVLGSRLPEAAMESDFKRMVSARRAEMTAAQEMAEATEARADAEREVGEAQEARMIADQEMAEAMEAKQEADMNLQRVELAIAEAAREEEEAEQAMGIARAAEEALALERETSDGTDDALLAHRADEVARLFADAEREMDEARQARGDAQRKARAAKEAQERSEKEMDEAVRASELAEVEMDEAKEACARADAEMEEARTAMKKLQQVMAEERAAAARVVEEAEQQAIKRAAVSAQLESARTELELAEGNEKHYAEAESKVQRLLEELRAMDAGTGQQEQLKKGVLGQGCVEDGSLRAIFDTMDRDKSGTVSREEVCCCGSGLQLTVCDR